MWWEMRQILFLNQIPELPSERLGLSGRLYGWGDDPTPVASPRHYSHRPKLFFATTNVAFGVVDPRGEGGASCRSLIFRGTENAICFAVAVCFSRLPFFLTVILRRRRNAR